MGDGAAISLLLSLESGILESFYKHFVPLGLAKTAEEYRAVGVIKW